MEKEERGIAPYIGIYIQIQAIFVLKYRNCFGHNCFNTKKKKKKGEKIERGFNDS